MVVATDEQAHLLRAFTAGPRFAPGPQIGGDKLTHRHAFQVAAAGEQHHGALVGNEVNVFQISLGIEDHGPSFRGKPGAQLIQFRANDAADALTARQDVPVVRDFRQQILVLQADFVRLQSRETPQLHLQDRLGLLGTETQALLQLTAGRGGVGSSANQADHLVQVPQGHEEALQHVIPFLRLAEQMAGATLNGLNPEDQERLQQLAQIEEPRLTLHQRHHVGAEVGLQGGELEQVVEHHLAIGIPPQLNDDAHPLPVTLVANIGNSLQLFFVHQFGNALNQGRLVHLVGKLGDDHRVPIRAAFGVQGLHRGNTPHGDGAPPTAIGLLDAATPQDLTTGGEIRTGNRLEQLLVAQLGITDEGIQTVNQFRQVVGGDIGGHAHGNAGRTVEQELGNTGRQHRGLLLGTVKGGEKVNGLAFNVLQQGTGAERLQARLRIPHGGRRIVVHRAEIAMAVNEWRPHGEVLGHAHQGVVDCGLTVGMVFTQHFPHHPGALPKRPLGRKAQFIHGVKDAPMDGLEAIAGIGQCPTHDDAHGVFQIGAGHLAPQIRGHNAPFAIGAVPWKGKFNGFRHAAEAGADDSSAADEGGDSHHGIRLAKRSRRSRVPITTPHHGAVATPAGCWRPAGAHQCAISCRRGHGGIAEGICQDGCSGGRGLQRQHPGQPGHWPGSLRPPDSDPAR